MRERKAARLLVISPSRKVLLFRFTHTQDALAGASHWATPGDGLEQGETFHAAAMRELREETGLQASVTGEAVAHRRVSLLLPSGETVLAVEQSADRPLPFFPNEICLLGPSVQALLAMIDNQQREPEYLCKACASGPQRRIQVSQRLPGLFREVLG